MSGNLELFSNPLTANSHCPFQLQILSSNPVNFHITITPLPLQNSGFIVLYYYSDPLSTIFVFLFLYINYLLFFLDNVKSRIIDPKTPPTPSFPFCVPHKHIDSTITLRTPDTRHFWCFKVFWACFLSLCISNYWFFLSKIFIYQHFLLKISFQDPKGEVGCCGFWLFHAIRFGKGLSGFWQPWPVHWEVVSLFLASMSLCVTQKAKGLLGFAPLLVLLKLDDQNPNVYLHWVLISRANQ